MLKSHNKTNKQNVETVENWKEYFYENFEIIELPIPFAKKIRFMLENLIKDFGKDFPDNIYKAALITIIQWIDTSIELHYSQQEFSLRKQNK